MAIDRDQALAVAFEPLTVTVERGRLQAFARATGQVDPIYTDVEAAKAAGHRDLPVPPTFLFSLELEYPDPFGYLADLGVDLRWILHGEQSFRFESLAHAGDTLTLRPTIVDAYSKRGGALDFLVKDTEVRRGEELLAVATSVIVVRNPEVTP
jgi:acyl dehydratase